MTKKDYETLAGAFQRVEPTDIGTSEHLCHMTWESAVHSVAVALAYDNPRFDGERFKRACRYGANVRAR